VEYDVYDASAGAWYACGILVSDQMYRDMYVATHLLRADTEGKQNLLSRVWWRWFVSFVGVCGHRDTREYFCS
jgi:hypothetical protein